jgi:hypothetical protein
VWESQGLYAFPVALVTRRGQGEGIAGPLAAHGERMPSPGRLLNMLERAVGTSSMLSA